MEVLPFSVVNIKHYALAYFLNLRVEVRRQLNTATSRIMISARKLSPRINSRVYFGTHFKLTGTGKLTQFRHALNHLRLLIRRLDISRGESTSLGVCVISDNRM